MMQNNLLRLKAIGFAFIVLIGLAFVISIAKDSFQDLDERKIISSITSKVKGGAKRFKVSEVEPLPWKYVCVFAGDGGIPPWQILLDYGYISNLDKISKDQFAELKQIHSYDNFRAFVFIGDNQIKKVVRILYPGIEIGGKLYEVGGLDDICINNQASFIVEEYNLLLSH